LCVHGLVDSILNFPVVALLGTERVRHGRDGASEIRTAAPGCRLWKLSELLRVLSLFFFPSLSSVLDATANHREQHEKHRPNNQVARHNRLVLEDVRNSLLLFGGGLASRRGYLTALFEYAVDGAVVAVAGDLLELAHLQCAEHLSAHALICRIINGLH